uniref:Uncharacterized protein n=1 Tax=Arundo donax TaxID=35708 RepID=A0A0A8XZ00_ARUDO
MPIGHRAISPTVMKRFVRSTHRACESFWSFQCSLKSKCTHLQSSHWHHVGQPPQFCSNYSPVFS